MAGGHDALVDEMKTGYAQMDKLHIRFVSHTSTPESQTIDAGAYEVLRVHEESVMEADGRWRAKEISCSLAVRRKPDGPWTFIGGTGLAKHPEMLPTFLPDLPKDFALPPYSLTSI